MKGQKEGIRRREGEKKGREKADGMKVKKDTVSIHCILKTKIDATNSFVAQLTS